MKFVLVISILTTLALLALGVVVALYHHKNASARDINLIGEVARVDTGLNPEGTVIVGGELWPAKSNDGAPISSRARVRVVGFEDHLALVERCD
ncbi:MAG TPA: NfeD family protein [Pyrinomonadaceae bacterium]|jgi:membrane-bound ClpP family serine protease|nr:NfeD family protein [Pyrinomonadaceae bacterium]